MLQNMCACSSGLLRVASLQVPVACRQHCGRGLQFGARGALLGLGFASVKTVRITDGDKGYVASNTQARLLQPCSAVHVLNACCRLRHSCWQRGNVHVAGVSVFAGWQVSTNTKATQGSAHCGTEA